MIYVIQKRKDVIRSLYLAEILLKAIV